MAGFSKPILTGKVKILPVFLFLNLLIPFNSFGNTLVSEKPHYATSEAWLALLRYQKKLSSYESEVDSTQYFLHPDGKTNPWLEYTETKRQIENSPEILCQFPARATLLERFGEIKPIDLSQCEEFVKFKDKLDLSSVSIVFSGYYINKPASAFGHTFFRLRSAEAQKKDNDFLDFGVDFSAIVNTSNPLVYGLKGIFGGFDSRFKLMPYYVKIREYNDLESRELWDYELNFSPVDLEYFVAHLYEMNRGVYDYFYFSENCSYHILNFVNAIKPEWETMKSLDWFVPPVQTIHALYNKPNVVKNIKYLPAQNKKFYKRYQELNSVAKKKLKEIIDTQNFDIINTLSGRQRLNMLDALVDYYDYIDASKLSNSQSPGYRQATNRKFKLNVNRSKITEKSAPLNFKKYLKQAPHNSHKTKRVKIGYINNDSADGVDFEMRFSFHDYMDNQIGFIPFSRSVLARFNLKYFARNKLRLNQFSLVNVDALRPLHKLEKNISWRINFGTMDDRLTKYQEFNPFLDLSLGVALRFNNFLFASFVKTKQLHQTRVSKGFNSSIGPEVLFIYNNNHFAFSTEYARLFTFIPDKSYTTWINNKLRIYFSKNSSLYISHEHLSKLNDTFMGGLALHF